MTNAVALAVAPLKKASVDAAIDRTVASQKAIIQKLTENNFDINLAFPRPKSTMSRAQYLMTADKRAEVELLVDFEKSTYRLNETQIVKVNADKIAYQIEEAIRDAEAAFDLYVTKLSIKVGHGIDTAELGFVNGLWSNSNLIVTKTDGSKEVWNTKCITNRSKLGKWFNQFPTRQLKK